MSNKEFSNLQNKEVTNNWKKIPIKLLDDAESLAHLDAKGFKYYIPALMLRLMDNYVSCSMMAIGTLSGLYPKKDNLDYHLERYSLLNTEQRNAISKYLKYLPELVNLETEDKKVVERAFNNYWHQFYLPKQKSADLR